MGSPAVAGEPQHRAGLGSGGGAVAWVGELGE